MGTTSASFQSEGTSPLSITCWNKIVRYGDSSVATLLSTLPGIQSGPAALDSLILVKCFRTPSSVIIISGINGMLFTELTESHILALLEKILKKYSLNRFAFL